MAHRFTEAHTAANASHHDEIAALASTTLTFYAANRLRDRVLAEVWLEVARGDVARLTRVGFASGVFFEAEAIVAAKRGQPQRGLAHYGRALRNLPRPPGPAPPRSLTVAKKHADLLLGAGASSQAA